MKQTIFIAFNVSRRVVLFGVLHLMAVDLRSETVCECASPPGGRVTCPDGNLAICVVKNGKAETKCMPIPKDILADTARLQFWVFKKVTGMDALTPEKIAEDDKLKKLMAKVLKELKYVQDDVTLTFKFPKDG